MLRFWLAVWGIQRLVFDVLGHNLEKPENIRVSTQWELVPLPPHAAAYAALDAHADTKHAERVVLPLCTHVYSARVLAADGGGGGGRV